MSIESEWRFKRNLTGKVYEVISSPAIALTSTLNDLNFENIGNIPKQGPFAIIPKHIRYLDSLYIGCGLYQAGAHSLCVSRPLSLFGSRIPARLLELVGTVTLNRPKEMRNYRETDKVQRRRKKKEVQEQNAKVLQFLETELANGGSVLFFPEGKRCPGEVGDFKPKFFDWAIGAEQRLGRKVGFLPVGLEYVSNGGSLGRQMVHVRFGTLHYYDSLKGVGKLMDDCREQVRELSNL